MYMHNVCTFLIIMLTFHKTILCCATLETHSAVGPSLLRDDDLECTARRSPRSVAQYRQLPANVKDSIVHHILLCPAQLRCCMKLHYINLLWP